MKKLNPQRYKNGDIIFIGKYYWIYENGFNLISKSLYY